MRSIQVFKQNQWFPLKLSKWFQSFHCFWSSCLHSAILVFCVFLGGYFFSLELREHITVKRKLGRLTKQSLWFLSQFYDDFLAVKIIINERTRQSLGYGYVWFNSKEDAQLAVEAMNGKVLRTSLKFNVSKFFFSAVCISCFGTSSISFWQKLVAWSRVSVPGKRKEPKALKSSHQNPPESRLVYLLNPDWFWFLNK